MFGQGTAGETSSKGSSFGSKLSERSLHLKRRSEPVTQVAVSFGARKSLNWGHSQVVTGGETEFGRNKRSASFGIKLPIDHIVKTFQQI